jgi:hypothetical protein
VTISAEELHQFGQRSFVRQRDICFLQFGPLPLQVPDLPLIAGMLEWIMQGATPPRFIRKFIVMAYDPEARQSSSTAMILGVAALVAIIGAIAYFATRPPATVDNTMVINSGPNPTPVTNTVIREREVPVPGSNPTVIVKPPSTSTNTTTRIERNNTTVIRQNPTPAAGSAAGSNGTATAPRTSNNTNVTVNVPPSGGAGGSDSSAAPTPADSSSDSSGTDNATADNAAPGAAY